MLLSYLFYQSALSGEGSRSETRSVSSVRGVKKTVTMASAAAMSIYTTLTGHALSLVIYFPPLMVSNLLSLAPEVDSSSLELLEAFFQ